MDVWSGLASCFAESKIIPMSTDATALLNEALSLPDEERESFASALWDSLGLEASIEDCSDSELLKESNRRRDELRSGAVKGISHEELKRSLGR